MSNWKWLAASAVIAAMAMATAHAATEPVAGTCSDKGGMCLWREPVVAVPNGWERKDNASSRYRASAFAPKGRNFATADAVMYAKAVPRHGNAATLAAFIAQDLTDFRRQYSKLGVQTGLTYTDGDGRKLQAVRLLPTASDKAQWETMVYAEEPESYVVFALSARSQAAHDAALAPFQQLLRGYHAPRATAAH